jgi:putative endonuclease
MDKRMIGILGEKLAREKYTTEGYEIVGANYHSRFGELDIIAAKNGTLVIAEVKTRNKKIPDYYSAKEAVTLSKQAKIKNSTLIYMENHPQFADFKVRFDVVEVYSPEKNPQINTIKNAFE